MESHAQDFGLNAQEQKVCEVKPVSDLSEQTNFVFLPGAVVPIRSLELLPGGRSASFHIPALQLLKGRAPRKVSGADPHLLQPQAKRHEVAVNTYDLQFA
jgi:hypothetical protein